MLNWKKMMALAVTGSLVMGLGGTNALAARKTAGKGQTVRNVILMIADGWGENQILAANYYHAGRDGQAIYQNFPTATFMSTYSVGSYDPSQAWSDTDYIKHRPTDSAAAGTAMSTGVKTYDAGIGVDINRRELKHVGQYFEEAGRSTGVVSSVQFYHATPAAFIAHDVNRNNYNTIAAEMINESAADVIMAPGHPMFNDNGQPAAPSFKNLNAMREGGKAVDGETLWNNLTQGQAGADADGDGQTDAWTFIETKAEFEAMTRGETPKRVFGVPQVASTLQQGRGGDAKAAPYAVPFNQNVPDLATMSRAALNVLDQDEDGLFLMIEGGAIDWSGHANQLGRNIEEMNDFNAAVEAVVDWVEENSSWSETLLIVAGDHETGYLSGSPDALTPVRSNGQGQLPGVYWLSGDHTNQLIPLYAKGPGAQLLKKYADERDAVRKRYLDNTEIVPAVLDLLD